MATACFAGVSVSAPGNGWTVGSPVHFVASATGSYPIASMIIYVDYQQAYLTYSNRLDTDLPMGQGWHFIMIKAWDNHGNIYQQNLNINVSGSTGGVGVSSPGVGATVGSPIHVVASATPSSGRRIASMIVYLDYKIVHTTYSDRVDTYVSSGSGWHNLMVKAWEDGTGKIYEKNFGVNVSGTTSSSGSSGGSSVTAGTTIWNVEQISGWQSCSSCAYDPDGSGPTTSYHMWQGIKSPSMDGNSTEYAIDGGSTPYTNVLFYKRLIGDATVNRNSRHFIYDTYFYVNNSNAVQALEFDVNQYVDNRALVFGTQCNVRAGNVWDVWDNPNDRWVSTGVYCPTPTAYTWHHVTVEVERTWDNWLRYVSITYDGQKYYLNRYYNSKWTSWNGVTVNFQLDGNYRQEPYKVWLDKFHFSYW